MKLLVCRKEALRENGEKLMQFTKGETYEAFETEEGAWGIVDDNGNLEDFFDLDVMFDELI